MSFNDYDTFFNNPKFNKIIFCDTVYPGSYIEDEINNLTKYIKLNIKSKSPFIYLFAYNHPKTVISYFAIIKAGFIVVLIDPEIKPLELKEFKEDTVPAAEIKFNIMDEKFNFKKEIIVNNNFKKFIIKSDLTDVCTIVYTGAEDGGYKGAMLTKKNIYSDAYSHATTNNSDENSVICGILPLHHLFGFVIGIIAPIISYSSILVVDISKLQKIKEIVESLNKYEVTHLYSIPIIYYLFSKIPDINKTLNKVKFFTSGGYKLPISIFNTYKEKFKIIIREGYGLTEASPVCSWNHPKDKVKPGSIGKAFTCCEIKIHNREICIQGSNVMKGYFNNKNATDKVIKNGWLHTGDIGKIDKDGYLYILGLKKKMFIKAGMNVFPKEVEKIILKHFNVKEVKVFGELNELMGHKIIGKIKLKQNTPELQNNFRKWCFNNISNYKIPAIFEFEE